LLGLINLDAKVPHGVISSMPVIGRARLSLDLRDSREEKSKCDQENDFGSVFHGS
jgi:hypothetical protein